MYRGKIIEWYLIIILFLFIHAIAIHLTNRNKVVSKNGKINFDKDKWQFKHWAFKIWLKFFFHSL